jgi:hypothetical protein
MAANEKGWAGLEIRKEEEGCSGPAKDWAHGR